MLIAYYGKKYLEFLYPIQFLDYAGIRDKLYALLNIVSKANFYNESTEMGSCFLLNGLHGDSKTSCLKASCALARMYVFTNNILAGLLHKIIYCYYIPWRWDTKERYPVWDYMPLVTCHDSS